MPKSPAFPTLAVRRAELVPVCRGLAGWRLPKRSRHSGVGAGVNIQVPCRPSLVDVPALRTLVNDAYRELADRGLNFTGIYQDEVTTRKRMKGSDVFLRFEGDALVASINLAQRAEEGLSPCLYINQLAVRPDMKRRSLGSKLLNFAEEQARSLGLQTLRLDTAIPATHLVSLYHAKGYKVVSEVQWSGKTYRSYIMEKVLSLFPSEPVTLKGLKVKLRPMAREDADPLFEVAAGEDLWKWYPTVIGSKQDMAHVVREALAERENGTALPFVICGVESGEIFGSSRFFNTSPKDKRLEVGWTWIGPRWQGSKVNLESKLLMLTYAFEKLGCIRVELKTDSRNMRSQKAMLKLGLKQEGILRSHMITHDGHYRDSVYFSVIDREWPEMKAALTARLTNL